MRAQPPSHGLGITKAPRHVMQRAKTNGSVVLCGSHRKSFRAHEDAQPLFGIGYSVSGEGPIRISGCLVAYSNIRLRPLAPMVHSEDRLLCLVVMNLHGAISIGGVTGRLIAEVIHLIRCIGNFCGVAGTVVVWPELYIAS